MNTADHDRLLIIDFGSQVTQLIARRLRELNIYCEIHPYQTLDDDGLRVVLRTPDEEVMDLVAAVSRLRRAHFGMTVKVNYLVNLKSGLCPEDCGYCSQRLNAGTDILKYSWLPGDEARRQARRCFVLCRARRARPGAP